MRENTEELLAGLIKRSSCVRFIAAILGFSLGLTVPACDTGQRHPSHRADVQPVLSASPNPVPAGDLDQPVGATVLTWNTGSGVIGALYVKANRSREVFVGSGPSGSINVDWIQFDSTYEFRLYNQKHSRVLAKLDVTREN